jgi:hypothetical protein
MVTRGKAALIGACIGIAGGMLRMATQAPAPDGWYVPQTAAGWIASFVGYLTPWALLGAAIGFFLGRKSSTAAGTAGGGSKEK